MEQIATTFDWALAYHCAPALAGIKPADLFSWPLTAMEEMREYQSALAACGVQLRVLRQGRRQLLLVYRAKCLDGGGAAVPSNDAAAGGELSPRDRPLFGLSSGGCGGILQK